MNQIQHFEPMGPTANVRITAFCKDTGKVLHQHETHNVLTDTGRTWLRDMCSTLTYANTDANSGVVPDADSKTNERPRYVGFGVGGALSSDPTTYWGTQEELSSVTQVEDFVKISTSPDVYLKEMNAQTLASDSYPNAYSVVFITDIAESEISFAGNVSASGTTVGTNVPVTEVGLYLSGADPSNDLAHATNTARCIAYNIFSPVYVTTNIVLRSEWEFLF